MQIKRNLNVSDARNVQQQTNHDVVIVLAFNPGDGRLEYASYGRDRAMCQLGKAVGDAMFESVSNMFADASKGVREYLTNVNAALPRPEGR